LLDLNAEEATVLFNNAGVESLNYRMLTDRDCSSRDTANESILDLRNSAYRQNLRFSSNLFWQVSNRWQNRCNLILDETKQLVRVNSLTGNCAFCSANYLDQGTGSLGSPVSLLIANDAIALNVEVEGLDPRLSYVREDGFNVRRRAIRLELIPGNKNNDRVN
jgi:hypothetical protein